ncbi:MAG: SDR family oxidoreductase [Opitutaceae bacterium]|jgi:NAD(P)-dependent dehydrogenase (short-subunit alcohol dehydrogenase family)|nr:SDR family oxidoreductase [Opitutaceae bacterium]MBP9913125.1 SDR family oxidoreductase [Opitutaceae bacterium]
MAAELSATPAPALHLPDLRGKVALVTGASAGIGRATIEALLANGATCYGLALEASPLGHPDFHALPCDLRDPAAIERAFTALRVKTTRLDYVVNVAGVDPKLSLAAGDAAAWDQIVDLNLRAYYLVIRESLELLRAGTGRAIVNVASINYRLGLPGRSIYSSTKAGILGLTTGLARELGRDFIRINTVSPGWIFTERQITEYFSGADTTKHLAHLAGVQSLPLRLQPQDVANHILFYLSEVSRASTGHNCVVDGGWLLE